MTNERLQELLQEIAQTHLCIETLESSGLDWLDFHDVEVVSLKNALMAAYELGANNA